MTNLEKHMSKFLDSLESAMEQKNWYAALTLAVTLPDICCRIDGTKDKRGKKPYIKWFDKYVGEAYKVSIFEKSTNDKREACDNNDEFYYLNGKNAYALRCAFLHDGTGDLENQNAHDKELSIAEMAFVIPEELDCGSLSAFGGSLIELKTNQGHKINQIIMYRLVLNIELYCRLIAQGIKDWILENIENNKVEEHLEKVLKIGSSKEVRWSN